MIDAPLAYAFGVGMVATVNPCGFAMLPAYLSFFLGLEGAEDDTRASVLQALTIGGVVTLGFLVVFGLLGILLDGALSSGQTMADKTGVTYDLVRDPDGSLIASIGGSGLPTTLLVKADGTVVRVAGPGAVKPDDLRRWIDQDLLS